MDIQKVTPQFIRNAYDKMGFVFFTKDNKPYNLNIWGIRTSDMTTDAYNDYIGYTYYYNGKPFHRVFRGTTDPSLYYLHKPMVSGGAALVKHGEQYRGVYQFGIHNYGKPTAHEALRQIKPMKYWRDNNRDSYRDCTGTIHTGIYYTNLHSRKANMPMLETIGKTSAGCQVIASPAFFHGDFIPTIKKAIPIWGDKFTYTLFFEDDIV